MVSESECQMTMISIPGVLDILELGKDYSEYSLDFILRTDAVWEKQQLKDWFRLTNRVI